VRLHEGKHCRRVVLVAHRHVQHGKPGLPVRRVHEEVPVLAVGPAVAAVIEFHGEQGSEAFRVAEEKIDVLLRDAPERGHVAALRVQNVCQADFALGDRLRPDGLA